MNIKIKYNKTNTTISNQNEFNNIRLYIGNYYNKIFQYWSV